MRIIISPAKKMRTDNDDMSHRNLPIFIKEAQRLKDHLSSMSYEALKVLWGCNDSIAQLNYDRLMSMDLYSNLTPAILASAEYSKVVTKYLSDEVNMITCVFGELIDGKIKEKGVYVKMARGEMVRYMAENSITDLEAIQGFDRLGFKYSDKYSSADKYVFIK